MEVRDTLLKKPWGDKTWKGYPIIDLSLCLKEIITPPRIIWGQGKENFQLALLN